MPDILNAQAAGGAQNGELGGGEFITDTDTAGFEADVIKASASQPGRQPIRIAGMLASRRRLE